MQIDFPTIPYALSALYYSIFKVRYVLGHHSPSTDDTDLYVLLFRQARLCMLANY
jgi:hypothetical protein